MPSGLKATDETEPVWPLRVRTSSPLRTSHSFTVRSSLPEASRVPSGLKATEETESLWPN